MFSSCDRFYLQLSDVSSKIFDMRKRRVRGFVDPLARPFQVRLYLTLKEKTVLQDAALLSFPLTARGLPRVGVAATALIRMALEQRFGTLVPDDLKNFAKENIGRHLKIRKRRMRRRKK